MQIYAASALTMVDFHSHVLPNMDDGSSGTEESLAMLREQKRQGCDVVFATSHYYAYDEDPASFLRRRTEAYSRLMKAAKGEALPKIYLGAEILYFPGMSDTDELKKLKMGQSNCILIEPPMCKWTDMMLDEIEQVGRNLKCIPVIAHLDRFMRLLNDYTLTEQVYSRRMLVQYNASFFLHQDTAPLAIKLLKEGKVHFIGTDCHNMLDRAPNMGAAAEAVKAAGAETDFAAFNKRIYYFLDLTNGKKDEEKKA